MPRLWAISLRSLVNCTRIRYTLAMNNFGFVWNFEAHYIPYSNGCSSRKRRFLFCKKHKNFVAPNISEIDTAFSSDIEKWIENKTCRMRNLLGLNIVPPPGRNLRIKWSSSTSWRMRFSSWVKMWMFGSGSNGDHLILEFCSESLWLSVPNFMSQKIAVCLKCALIEHWMRMAQLSGF